MEKGIWEKEEFDDIIVRSLIGLYDDKNITNTRAQHPLSRVTKSDIAFARNIGCYIVPNDRIIDGEQLDFISDGLPPFASFTEQEERQSSPEDLRDYITLYFAKRLKRLPGSLKTLGHKAYYEMLTWAPQASGGSYLHKMYIGFSISGKAYPAFAGDMLRFGPKYQQSLSLLAQATLQFWQDRRYLWNVQAIEAEAKCTFGVYENQIKSLLYSRKSPLAETGRRRPILHWVRSHRRRMKSGVDIDIEKHLRGITEFVMDGTMFRITRPIKRNESIETQQAA